MPASSQKFIARNRAPRVQIEYDVELYGAEKKVQLPFVMGVFADLAGNPSDPLPAVADRKFLEIDVDNFDERLKAMRPRAAFTVPNTISGEGSLAVDLTFEAMDDFAPAAIARKVEPLRRMLEARTQLSNLLTYMDGKTGAEALIERVLQDPGLLTALASAPSPAPDAAAAALAALRASAPASPEAPDTAAAALATLRASAPASPEAPDAAAAALATLRGAIPVSADAPDTTVAALAALRDAVPVSADALDSDAAALAELRAPALASPKAPDTAAAALAALRAGAPPPSMPADDPLAGLDDLLAPPPAAAAADPLAGLDDLLAPPPPVAADDPLAGFDDLLAPSPAAPAADPLAGLDVVAIPLSDAKRLPPAGADSGLGFVSAALPDAQALVRPAFRMALLGDFSGRAARGIVETGAALAGRRAITLDIDNVEEVIAGFATTIVLPVGPEGRGIAVPLSGLDALHPDRLVENVGLFDALKGLRQRLSAASTAAGAVAEMQGWGDAFTTPVTPSAGRSAAASVPADWRLTDFQRLIGDTEGRLTRPSPAEELIGRIVGPHVVPGPNAEAQALRGAVDEAMATAMRLVLHHPEFQAIEAQWRSLDLLARRIETDEKLEIVLFDISAEEFAADLSATPDLAGTGVFGLLNDPLTIEGGIGFSAVLGLYTFEETPPHAVLLGRMAQIAAHLQAPFLAALTAGFLEVAKADRHPLVAQAWDDLGAEPAAAWLGLATPRFLLRRPYGHVSEPIDAFAFEEFTNSEGLSGMLWANPVVLLAILIAQAWTDGKGKMALGATMSVGDMPYHVATDRHGDQIALPCTERNMTTGKVESAVSRGLMPLISIQGRDVVRLGAFQSVAGTEIAGRWSDMPPPMPRRVAPPTLETTIPAAAPTAASIDDELDALLAGFGDAPVSAAGSGSIDADLAALLEGL